MNKKYQLKEKHKKYLAKIIQDYLGLIRIVEERGGEAVRLKEQLTEFLQELEQLNKS